MKDCVRFFRGVTVFIALFCLSFTNLMAQTRASQTKVTLPIAKLAVPKSEPFKVGETLIYEAKYSRLLLRGIDVADLTFSVAEDDLNAPNKITFKAQATSKGGLLKLVSYSFLQKFDCTVQTDDFRVLQTVRYDEQDKRIRNGEANFDYTMRKLIYREIDPTNPLAPPRVITSPLEGGVQDLVSAIYYLRRQPLIVGKELLVRLSDSGVVYEVPIKVAAREQVNTVLGKVWALRLEPEIFGDKRLLAGEGKMHLWLTDDARRLPVRAQIQAKVGKIEIKLRRAENLQPIK